MQFEKAFSALVGAPYGVAVDQGRTALFLALKALGIHDGDEVIVQSLTCQVVIDAILEVGALPVLVDSSLDDFQVSPVDIEKKLSARTRAVIVAHIYGIPCQLEQIKEITTKKQCYLIEDCAHSVGSRYKGKHVGTFGDLAYFSFNYDKPVTTGNGGMLVVNNPNLIDRIDALVNKYERVTLTREKEVIYALLLQYLLTHKRVYQQHLPIDLGVRLLKTNPSLSSMLDQFIQEVQSEDELAMMTHDHIKRQGLLPHCSIRSIMGKSFYRTKNLTRRFIPAKLPQSAKIEHHHLLMNSLRAAFGLNQLRDYDSVVQKRNRNAAYYSEHLDQGLYRLPVIDTERRPAFLKYTVMNQTGLPLSKISDAANKAGFELGNYNWPRPVHLMQPYRRIVSHDRALLSRSEQIANLALNIPMYTSIEKKELEQMVAFLNSFNRKK
ncbi:aminotransferase class I/II-fold pyridoxal phosphate-dependent enzyme [candidate division KSB1 bacterium]|nr:aminotransferase class I/II-fold pyridoxal phosphate-dependent enzyme [candidate division KSB1 bacterium]